MKLKGNAFVCPIIFGIVMILIGFSIRVPGGALTTYSSLNGTKTEEGEDYFSFDNKYSTIDEYVGGDAYNYEIGASLVAGKTAGAMTSRSIFIVGGLICICFGVTLMMSQNGDKVVLNEDRAKKENENNSPVGISIEHKNKGVSQDVELKKDVENHVVSDSLTLARDKVKRDFLDKAICSSRNVKKAAETEKRGKSKLMDVIHDMRKL